MLIVCLSLKLITYIIMLGCHFSTFAVLNKLIQPLSLECPCCKFSQVVLSSWSGDFERLNSLSFMTSETHFGVLHALPIHNM